MLVNYDVLFVDLFMLLNNLFSIFVFIEIYLKYVKYFCSFLVKKFKNGNLFLCKFFLFSRCRCLVRRGVGVVWTSVYRFLGGLDIWRIIFTRDILGMGVFLWFLRLVIFDIYMKLRSRAFLDNIFCFEFMNDYMYIWF